MAVTGFDNCTLLKEYCPKDDPGPYMGEEVDYLEPKCKYFFNLFEIEDWAAGLILLIFSLTAMILTLLLMVKVLNSLLKGKSIEVDLCCNS